MIALVKAISLAFPASQTEAENLQSVVIICGLGLLISLCVASYGLDLSPGFF